MMNWIPHFGKGLHSAGTGDCTLPHPTSLPREREPAETPPQADGVSNDIINNKNNLLWSMESGLSAVACRNSYAKGQNQHVR
jgi:hypothetical protein